MGMVKEMELLYVITLECFFCALLYSYVESIILILITLFISLLLFLFYKKSLVIILIPFLLVLRMTKMMDNSYYDKEDVVIVELKLEASKGEIKKINGKTPSKKTQGKVDYLEDGNYKIKGIISRIEERYGQIFYDVKVLEKKELKDSFIKKYFLKKAENFTKNSYIDFKNMYMAVILGESSRLDRDLKNVFSYTGTSHLLALSGLHVGIIFGVIMFLLRGIPVMSKTRYWIALVSVTLYFLGVKNSPSLTRAYIMIIVIICGKLFDENVDPLKSLTLSFLISIFLNPLSINENSLRFSYLAVFAILEVFPLVKKKLYKGKSKFIEILILSLIIQVFLSPILIKDFGKLSFLSFGTNVVIMPIGSFYITLAFIALLIENIGLGFIIMPLVKLVFNIFYKSIFLASKLPYLTLEFENNIPNSVFIIFYMIVFGIIFYRKLITERSNKDEKKGKRRRI